MRTITFPIVALLLLVASGSSCVSSPRPNAARGEAARDFTFFLLFSDVHTGAEDLKAKPLFTKADTLARHVGASGEPIVLMHHFGFDSFSLNDWNWWTPKQRRALYELLKDYNVAAFFHGHNHHAEHYRWPDPKRHAADLHFFFDGQPPPHPRQYDVPSCGEACWVIRVRGHQLIAAHYKGSGWNADPAAVFVKSLKP